jgi:hypothetical protein
MPPFPTRHPWFSFRPIVGFLLAAAVGVPLAAATVLEDFSTMPAGTCQDDGTSIGGWQFVFDGYGCSGFVSIEGNTMLVERPAESTQPTETHGALVVGPSVTGDVVLEVDSVTTRQLRTGSAPNPWEAAWVLWHYADNTRFYYFVAKPNGWELGKEDPAYTGAQRFLATGSVPAFPVGAWYRVRIEQAGTTIRAFVNGQPLVTVTDQERPYTSGRIGLYSEDAEVYFDNVALTTPSKPGKGKKPR